jgi:hypothetical protein
MSDFGLGDDITSESKRDAALKWHFGTYYFLPQRPEPIELLANPPFATGTEYQPASGTGAFVAKAAKDLKP